ncbi:hypothetical protein HYH02_004279 [Chlamydomonas schloesseri]|uniref:Protein kinase domain-containing protein n=1 Tax=Chlamydomonas schloesseri TaxID=2026947 RepID=A0A835WPH2_9CHLO|nr:hypothetical protein HYH02_004279 [Chlamydomonas schloesseri]|eukprot:KAG2451009.1 hypothetical protein HYH02_004279 [Chlamydomonas schloesseri]
MYGPLDSPGPSTSGTPHGPSCTGGGHGEAPPSVAGTLHPHQKLASPIGRQSQNNMQLPSPLCTATATPLARHLANRALRKAGDSAPLSLPSLTGGLRLRDAGAAALAAANAATAAAGGGGGGGGVPQHRFSSGGIGDGSSPRPPAVTSVHSMREVSPRMRRATTLDTGADRSASSISSGGSSGPLSPSGPSAAAFSAATTVGEGGAVSPSGGGGGGSSGRPQRFQRLYSMPARHHAFGTLNTGPPSPSGSSTCYSGPTAQFSTREEPGFARDEGEDPQSASGPLPALLAAGPGATSPRDGAERELSSGGAYTHHSQQPQVSSEGAAPHPPTAHQGSHHHAHGPSHLRPMPAPLLSPQPQPSAGAAAAAADARRVPQNRRRSEMAMLVVPAPETPLPRLRNAATAAASMIADNNTVGRSQPAAASAAAAGAGDEDFYVGEGEPGMEGIEEGDAEGVAGISAGGGDDAYEDILPTRPEPVRAVPPPAALSVQVPPVPTSPPSAAVSAAPSAASGGSAMSSATVHAGPRPASNTSPAMGVQLPPGAAAAAAAAAPRAENDSMSCLSDPMVSPGTERIPSIGPAPPSVMTSPKEAKAAAGKASPKGPSPMAQSPAQSPLAQGAPAPAAAAAAPPPIQTKPQAHTVAQMVVQAAAAASGGSSPRSPYSLPVPGAFVARPVPKDGLVHLSSAAPPAMSVRPAAAWGVGDFKIVRKLYAGYASSVYKATCTHSDTDVVLKAYNLMGLSTFLRHQVLRELDIHARLHHPSIVHLLAAFKECDILVLVQEYVRGGSLDRVRRKLGGRMTEFQAMHLVLLPLLNVLQHLHARGIIHRDIKPENLLFTEDWQLKVCDYGVSVCLHEERAVTRTGSREYMAPEVNVCPLKRGPEDNKDNDIMAYTPAVDVWSLGALMYELLVGFTPFPGGPPAHPTAGQAAPPAKALAYPGGVSQEARAFIQSCLDVEPSNRPTVPQLLQHPWIQEALEQDIKP